MLLSSYIVFSLQFLCLSKHLTLQVFLLFLFCSDFLSFVKGGRGGGVSPDWPNVLGEHGHWDEEDEVEDCDDEKPQPPSADPLRMLLSHICLCKENSMRPHTN